MTQNSMGTGESRIQLNSKHPANDYVDLAYSCQPYEYSLHSLEEKDDSVPFPRSGHRIVCDDGNLYAYGGYNPKYLCRNYYTSTNLFSEVWKYNFAQMKWKQLPIKSIPHALASAGLLISGKLLMVYGGTGMPFHLARSNEFYLCNLDEEELDFKLIDTKGKIPPPLYGQAIFLKYNHLYTVGGTTGLDYFMDIHRLNLQTAEWEEVYISKGSRDDPNGRYRHELAVVGDKVYIIGGGIGTEAFSFEEIPVFNLKQNCWDNLPAVRDSIHGYPPKRQYHSVVQIPDKTRFIMVGGMSDNDIVLDDAWILDIPTLQWKKACSLQLGIPVYFHASCVTAYGKMYIFGGVTKSGENVKRVADVQSSWICIPKLKEICWEAVTEYGFIENEKYVDHKVLPLEYTKRLVL